MYGSRTLLLGIGAVWLVLSGCSGSSDPMFPENDAQPPDATPGVDGGAGTTGGAGGRGGSGGASSTMDSGLPQGGSGPARDADVDDGEMDAGSKADGGNDGGSSADAGHDGGSDADVPVDCPPMTFGASCEPVTCQNGTCEAGTCSGPTGNGECDACDEGWVGPNCNWICTPYAIEACYEGTDATQGTGICRSGIRVCHQSGLGWSACTDQITPRAEDICGNGLDDDCDGSEADEVCDSSGMAVWVDAESGNDSTGDGSYGAPFATLNRGLQTGQELIIVVADEDGTVYEEDLELSSSHSGVTFSGWGPTRPTLAGSVSLTHCYDCSFENMELAYPSLAEGDSAPRATVRGVHNYRSVWRNVRFSAPFGLPAGASLYSTHHGYDNVFADVEVDDVVLEPGADAPSPTYALLNAYDHGTGSQFIRVHLGSIRLEGTVPETLDLQLIRAWGYCDQRPEAVTAVRNALITGLDMSGMATATTRFQALDLGCYLAFEEPTGFMVLNNTFAHITATSVTFAQLDLAEDMRTWISSNIVGPHAATTVTGLTSNEAATVDYSDFYQVTTPVSDMAALGSNMLTAVPRFVGGGDYHLDTGSPCIDSGDPNLTDDDGTRSDMGAYGGPLAR